MGLAELALDQLDEIAVSIDDYLAPSWARLTVITVGRIASDLEEWFQRWLDDARAGAANVGIDLFALDFRTPPEVTLEEYRRMNPIWTR